MISTSILLLLAMRTPRLPAEPVPELLPGVTSGARAAVMEVVRLSLATMRETLRSNDRCSTFLGGLAQVQLDRTWYGTFEGDPHVAAFTDPQDRNRVYLNVNGPIFTYRPGQFAFGRTDLSPAVVPQVYLFHEMGHQLGIFGQDANDAALNERYSALIISNCFQGRPPSGP